MSELRLLLLLLILLASEQLPSLLCSALFLAAAVSSSSLEPNELELLQLHFFLFLYVLGVVAINVDVSGCALLLR